MASRGINKVILIGYLGQNPEIRRMPNGNAVTKINIATSEYWKDKQTGEKKEKTEWHKIVLFGKIAEIAGEYLHKGSQVYIEGSLQTRKWQDQNGQEKYITEIIVNMNGTLQMLGSKNNNKNNINKQEWDKEDKNTTENIKYIGDNLSKIREQSTIVNKKSKIDKDMSLDFDDEIPF